jgi:hypothetical protein
MKTELNPMYDHPTDELVPCQCGFKPDHYSVYYSRTPYDIWCPNCRKQLNFARCKVTGNHENAIDYWNSHLAVLTLSEIEQEVEEFMTELENAIREEGMRPKSYNYYWEKDKGEILYQRW